jgi:hypothetical protein
MTAGPGGASGWNYTNDILGNRTQIKDASTQSVLST